MPDQPSPEQNHLLAAFPRPSQDRLFPQLERVDLPLGNVLHASDQGARHVYFPTDAVLSLTTRHGASIEVSVVGNEGLFGVSPVLGGEAFAQSRAIVQCSGSAYRLAGQLLRDEFDHSFAVMILLLHYTRYRIVEVTQPIRCEQHHSVDQQICHWLLLSLDRVPCRALTMTQQLMANMLGVQRKDITAATAKLRRDGVIGYERGQITVLDRASLEQLSCACHAAIINERRAARANLLPYLPPELVKLLEAETKAA